MAATDRETVVRWSAAKRDLADARSGLRSAETQLASAQARLARAETAHLQACKALQEMAQPEVTGAAERVADARVATRAEVLEIGGPT